MNNRAVPALNFDEGWYLSSYPDVARAISHGDFGTAVEHYLQFGSREGRLPVAPQPDNERVFVYGSFGSNNVGDEAILEGVRKIYPKCHQFYLNKRRGGSGSFPHEALMDRNFFRSGDYLIIGGGGLLYDRPTVSLMASLAKAARAAGATVDILRLGCEAAGPEYHDVIRELFSQARYATVRSTESQRVMRDILGHDLPVEMDFAFNLRGMAREIRYQPQSDLTIGLVTASMSPQVMEAVSNFITKQTRRRQVDGMRFVHIPHSRSYFNLENNDCLLGETIWTRAAMENAWSEDAFALWPFRQEPRDCLADYRKLDGVIGFRYHSLIFANLCDLPTLAVGVDHKKVASFYEDHPSSLTFGAAIEELDSQFEPFLKCVRELRGKRMGKAASAVA